MSKRSAGAWILLMAALGLTLAGCNLTAAAPTPTLSPATVQPVIIDGRDTLTPPLLATATATLDTTCLAAIARPDWVIYIVQDGDSLGDLAQRTNTTTDDIVNVNCLQNADAIYTGQALLLPQIPTP
jgi:LysM repeat protein